MDDPPEQPEPGGGGVNVDLDALVRAVDQKRLSATEDARERLVPYGSAILGPALDAYPELRYANGRRALVYTAMKFARHHDKAVELGRRALMDRAYSVRYYACMLLAFSGCRDTLSDLEQLTVDGDTKSSADAKAAIAAIRAGNHHLFLDRNQTGRMRLNILGDPDPPSRRT